MSPTSPQPRPDRPSRNSSQHQPPREEEPQVRRPNTTVVAGVLVLLIGLLITGSALALNFFTHELNIGLLITGIVIVAASVGWMVLKSKW